MLFIYNYQIQTYLLCNTLLSFVVGKPAWACVKQKTKLFHFQANKKGLSGNEF